MGSFSIWHWIILLLVLGIPATLVGLLVWLAARGSGKSARAAMPVPSRPPPLPSTGARLQELATLKSQGLISEAEYEQKRAALLDDL